VRPDSFLTLAHVYRATIDMNVIRSSLDPKRAGHADASRVLDAAARGDVEHVESFGSRIRDELLSVELFACLAEARVLVEDWRQDYNHHRPHSALGMMTPVHFAIGYREARLAAARAGDELRSPSRLAAVDAGDTLRLQTNNIHRGSAMVSRARCMRCRPVRTGTSPGVRWRSARGRCRNG
jgi:hypothetical protein